jgi:hypothetical protein
VSFSFFYHSLSLTSRLSSTGYTQAFWSTLPKLVAIGSGNVNAGDDPEADEEDKDEFVFADRLHGNQQDKTEHHNSPEQHPAEPDLYPDLDEELPEAVAELVGLDLNENGDGEDIMKIRTKRINYFPDAGAPLDWTNSESWHAIRVDEQR